MDFPPERKPGLVQPINEGHLCIIRPKLLHESSVTQMYYQPTCYFALLMFLFMIFFFKPVQLLASSFKTI